jgi:hypothetical protein
MLAMNVWNKGQVQQRFVRSGDVEQSPTWDGWRTVTYCRSSSAEAALLTPTNTRKLATPPRYKTPAHQLIGDIHI